MQSPTPERIILITGASRGIGAEVAQQLASPDTHVVVNYRENVDRAQGIVDAIRAAGGSASTLAADISDEADVAAMMGHVAARHGRLDALILNASSGHERGADPTFAMRRNGDAQRRLALLATPLMPAGGRIVFVTSHQAHFFPNKAVPKGYAPIAASKRAGETALYAMRSEFERAAVRFIVVSGDVIEATLPTVSQFAAAITNAVTIPDPSSIVYVRGADYLMTAA
jgi:NAD(P)-dependent dehydrogenase (short-subunit alcohol dehydrogenase family)